MSDVKHGVVWCDASKIATGIVFSTTLTLLNWKLS